MIESRIPFRIQVCVARWSARYEWTLVLGVRSIMPYTGSVFMAEKATAVVLNAPNKTCDQIFTNRPWCPKFVPSGGF